MFTYDVVSESIRNPHELAAELTRRSEQGWEVVQVVYDGATWFHAFIRHEGRVGIAPYPGASAPKALDSAVDVATSSQVTSASDTSTAALSGAATGADTATQPVASATTPTTTASDAPAASSPATSSPASTEPSVPEVPANWYKDPSGRFELRYWNGTSWTEHVATGGRQSVDPPKA